MSDNDKISMGDFLATVTYNTQRTWVIVGFVHPNESQSLIYKKCKRTETLLRYVEEGINKGCNLFSIRGVNTTYAIVPDSEQTQLGGTKE